MEQIDFMNQEISAFEETELTDIDLLNAVELLSYPAAAPQTTTTTTTSSRFVPHVPLNVFFRTATEL